MFVYNTAATVDLPHKILPSQKWLRATLFLVSLAVKGNNAVKGSLARYSRCSRNEEAQGFQNVFAQRFLPRSFFRATSRNDFCVVIVQLAP